MTTEIKEMNGVSCAVVHSGDLIITDGQTALDFIMNVKYETGCDRITLNKEAIAESFFVLSSGLAGEALQKFSNYRMKLAVVGDFSGYTSKPLKDFIYECNSGRDIFFVASEQEAVEKLTSVS